MKKLIKRTVQAVVGILALAIVGAIIFAGVYDFNKFKPRIEEAATEATGLPLKIAGDIGIKILPMPAVSVKDVRFGKEKSEVVTAAEINASVSLLPLLRKKIEVGKVEVVKPAVSIVRYKNGRYNFEGKRKKKPTRKEKEAAAAPAVLVGKVVVSNGDLSYQDKSSDTKVYLNNFNLKVKDLSIDPTAADIMKAVSLNGTFDASALKAKEYTVSDIDMRYRLKGGVLDVKPMTMEVFDGKSEGSLSIDFTKKKPRTDVAQNIKGLDLGMLVKQTSGKETLKGKANITAKLTMRGLSGGEIRRSIGGDVSMRGGDMVFYGVNLDDTLSKLQKSGKFNLMDFGSIFLLGPFGPLMTKSAGMAGVAVGGVDKGEQSAIKKLVFDWDVKDGIATTRDAAFSTPQNRLAFRGKLDFVNERFVDLTAGVLNPEGCTTFEQTLVGPFSKPKIKKEGIVKSIFKPFASLFGGGKSAECKEPFYKGEVEHPATGG
jgi:AsmA protein